MEDKPVPWNPMPCVIINTTDIRAVPSYADRRPARAVVPVNSIICWYETTIPGTNAWGVCIRLTDGVTLFTWEDIEEFSARVARAFEDDT